MRLQDNMAETLTYVLKIKESDECFQDLYILWLRDEIPQQTFIQSSAAFKEFSKAVCFGHVGGKIGIYELVLFQKRHTRFRLRIETSGCGKYDFLLRFGLQKRLWHREVLETRR